MNQGSHRSSLAGSPLECGSGSPSGAREDGLNINGGSGASPSSTYPCTASGAFVREYAEARFPQAPAPTPPDRDPRRRATVAYAFLSPRSGRFSFALLVSTALVMLCFHLLHLPPYGLVTLSVTKVDSPSTFTRSSPLGTGTCHLVHGEWLF